MLYPNLYHIIREVGADNGMNLLKDPGWGFLNTESLERFERDASLMNEEERVVFATAEQQEQNDLIRKYGIFDLHVFIDEIFDGPYTDFFYVL